MQRQFMGLLTRAATLGLLGLTPVSADPGTNQIRVPFSLISLTKTTSCSQAPPQINAIATSDPEVYFFLALAEAQAGGQVGVEWVRPDGVTELRQTTQIAADQGTSPCWYFTLKVAGTSRANYLGIWTVRAYYNSSILTQLSLAMEVNPVNRTPGDRAPDDRSPAIGVSGGGPSTTPPGAATLNISAKCNIFDAGRTTTSGGGILPVVHSFTAGAGKVLTFSSVTGMIRAVETDPDCPPDGCRGSTDVFSSQGISGVKHNGRNMFLTGVFLDDRTPSPPGPARLEYVEPVNASTFAPAIAQAFYIGDGLTGSGSGSAQQFQVPATATRLFLGFVDAWGFYGVPDSYGYNWGSLSATFQVGAASGSGSTGGGGSTGSTTPGCDYLVQAPAELSSVPWSGGVYVIRITTALNCAWPASANVNWISFRTATSGSGNGAVEFQVAPNPSQTSARSGTVTVANRTFTVTQGPAPACTYTLNPTSAQATAGGGTGTVRVTASASNCTWTAAANHSWLSVVSTTADTLTYQVQPNTATTPRTGTITVAQTLTFTVNQAAGGEIPRISQGGIVNAASYSSLGIARESFMSIFGEKLASAPAEGSYPIPTLLGEVRVTFTKGSESAHCYLVFVSPSQINCIVPRAAPTGRVDVTVTHRGVTSAPYQIMVFEPVPGLFFQRQGGRDIGIMQNVYSETDRPLNTPTKPAEPGMWLIAWATGLGANIGPPENQANPGVNMLGRVVVDVKVGGVEVPFADVNYAGTAPYFAGSNIIQFRLPQDVPLGCYVPVDIRAEAQPANRVVIAISSSRNIPCTP